jgi:sugar/nucleoside kinase (ribokinase family)
MVRPEFHEVFVTTDAPLTSRVRLMPGSPPLIFGPAYLDRVVRVDRPLVDPAISPAPLDGSVDGQWLEPGEGLTLLDPLGNRLIVELPSNWPGPSGTLGLSRTLAKGAKGWSRTVQTLAWQDDLGGMGAGYAVSMGGELISALGPEDDPTSRKIAAMLAKAGVTHHPIRLEGTTADWTLLITSGEHGDKLPIGFRGCHASLKSLGNTALRSSPLRIAAALPNRLASEALQGPSTIRAFAPSLRNMLDRDPPISAFAQFIDILTCNRGEWEQLEDREQVACQLSILVVTDGPHGATLRSTTPEGEAARLEIPAFPRTHPPLDTNRAGEAFASTLLTTLIDRGWTPGSTEPSLARLALDRASAAAALVIGRLDFGFPTAKEIDEAIRAGAV